MNSKNNVTGKIYDLQGQSIYVRYCTTAFRPSVDSIGMRGNIRKFSPRSASRMRRYLRCCDAEYIYMVTLTYPAVYPTDGRRCKQQLRTFISRYRRMCERNGYSDWSLFWFVEFQERGAPHFHLFITHPLPRAELSRWWYEIVGSGDAKHLAAGTRIERFREGRTGASVYASKYAAKSSQKCVPVGFDDVGRFWGVSGRGSCHSVTVFVASEQLDSKQHKTMQNELREALKAAPNDWKPIKVGPDKVSIGIFLRCVHLRAKAESILHRNGLIMDLAPNSESFIEIPTLGADCYEMGC